MVSAKPCMAFSCPEIRLPTADPNSDPYCLYVLIRSWYCCCSFLVCASVFFCSASFALACAACSSFRHLTLKSSSCFSTCFRCSAFNPARESIRFRCMTVSCSIASLYAASELRFLSFPEAYNSFNSCC